MENWSLSFPHPKEMFVNAFANIVIQFQLHFKEFN